jgi:hypothetical protein
MIAINNAGTHDLYFNSPTPPVQGIATDHIIDLAITNAKINDLSASKITTGTLDANVVTVSSADGKMTLSGNILAINNGAGTRQVTLGKYDGTNYGMVIGSNTSSPDVTISSAGISVNNTSILQMRTGADIIFKNSTETVQSVIGYVLTNFTITGDSTNGTRFLNPITFDSQTVVFDLGSTTKGIELRDGGYVNFFRPDDSSIGGNQARLQLTNSNEFRIIVPSTGNAMEWNASGNMGFLNLGAGAGSYGAGAGVFFIANRTTAPSSNPTAGGILYAESGALKWRGSGGTTTTIAAA